MLEVHLKDEHKVPEKCLYKEIQDDPEVEASLEAEYRSWSHSMGIDESMTQKHWCP